MRVPRIGIKSHANSTGCSQAIWSSPKTMATLTRNWRLLASTVNGRGLSTVASANGADGVETKLVKIPELGEVKGSSSVTAWSQKKFYQFLGIRYAEPPIGKLRFKVSASQVVH